MGNTISMAFKAQPEGTRLDPHLVAVYATINNKINTVTKRDQIIINSFLI